MENHKPKTTPASPAGGAGSPLAAAPQGQRCRILEHRGGRMLRARLLAMGLNPGREVEVLQNNRGLIILGVNGGRIALGRSVSHKILVEPLNNVGMKR